MATQATVFITLVGICWGVAVWVPFAIIMEVCNYSLTFYAILIFPQFLKDSASTPGTSIPTRRPSHGRVLSTPIPYHRIDGERQPLIRRRSLGEHEVLSEEVDSPTPTAGGTILGIHNLAIVAPQFIVSPTCPPSICFYGISASGCSGH